MCDIFTETPQLLQTPTHQMFKSIGTQTDYKTEYTYEECKETLCSSYYYTSFIDNLNGNIKGFTNFVDNNYFRQILPQFKKEEDLKLLKEFSELYFDINENYNLEEILEFAKKVEKIMDDTDNLSPFGKSFSVCFVWHVKEIINKITNLPVVFVVV